MAEVPFVRGAETVRVQKHKESEMYVPNRVIRPQLEVVASASVPTRFGIFDMHVFRWRGGEAPCENGLSPDHVALTMGSLQGAEDVLLRVHSECLTSEVFGSLKCDCRAAVGGRPTDHRRCGARGGALLASGGPPASGWPTRSAPYELQGEGHDTVDANRMLGLPDDARTTVARLLW